jgi:hypothetical protein
MFVSGFAFHCSVNVPAISGVAAEQKATMMRIRSVRIVIERDDRGQLSKNMAGTGVRCDGCVSD